MAVGGSASETSASPSIVTSILDSLTATEPYGREDTMLVPSADGESTPITGSRPTPETTVITSHTPLPTGETSTHATMRTVSKEAPMRAEVLEDEFPCLASRRGGASNEARIRSPSRSSTPRDAGDALPAGALVATSTSAIVAGFGALAIRPREATSATASAMSTDTITNEGVVVARPYIT